MKNNHILFVSTGKTHSTNKVVHRALVSSGCDDNSAPVGARTAADLDGNVFESYEVAVQVGGSVISTSSTALLLAGISTNALWILPALAGIAGISFAVLRVQVSRKNI